MIWDDDTYNLVVTARFRKCYAVTDEMVFKSTEENMLDLFLDEATTDFRTSLEERHPGIRVRREDLQTRVEKLERSELFNISRYEVRSRWAPRTITVFFQKGPLDGRIYSIQEKVIASNQPIVAVEPSVPIWSVDTNPSPLDLRRVLYYRRSWDDELNSWVYRPEN
jgi:hypothetical protein